MNTSQQTPENFRILSREQRSRFENRIHVLHDRLSLSTLALMGVPVVSIPERAAIEVHVRATQERGVRVSA